MIRNMKKILLIDLELPTLKINLFAGIWKNIVDRSQNSYLSKKWIVSKVFLKDFVQRGII